MKASIGGSMLLYIVLFFVSIVILFFVGIIAYTKAYRVKNRIVNIIEENGGYTADLKATIDGELKKYGYLTTKVSVDCKKASSHSNSTCENLPAGQYKYCICHTTHNSGKVYEVITYTQFDIPLIGGILSNAVHGETKTLGVSYDYR